MSLTWWKAVLINWGKKSLIFLCVFATLAWIRGMNATVAWEIVFAESRAEEIWCTEWRKNNPDAEMEKGDFLAPDQLAWREYRDGSPFIGQKSRVPQSEISKWLEDSAREAYAWRKARDREATRDSQYRSSSLPPVKLNTGSITPLSREKLRMHEELVRDLLN